MRESQNNNKVGSALIESCLIIVMLCLILFGILQVSYMVAAREVLGYTAIGLNDFMLLKVSHFASIPTAGPIINSSTDSVNSLMNSLPEDAARAKWDHAMKRSNTPGSSQAAREIALKESFHLADE